MSSIGDLARRPGNGIDLPLSQTSNSTQLTGSSNKSLRLTATIGKVHLGEHELKQKEALDTTKVINTASTCQENAPEDYESAGIDDKSAIHFSQAHHNCTTEDEEVQLKNTPNFASYSLQQWMLETSNSCITFAERLEKSK